MKIIKIPIGSTEVPYREMNFNEVLNIRESLIRAISKNAKLFFEQTMYEFMDLIWNDSDEYVLKTLQEYCNLFNTTIDSEEIHTDLAIKIIDTLMNLIHLGILDVYIDARFESKSVEHLRFIYNPDRAKELILIQNTAKLSIYRPLNFLELLERKGGLTENIAYDCCFLNRILGEFANILTVKTKDEFLQYIQNQSEILIQNVNARDPIKEIDASKIVNKLLYLVHRGIINAYLLENAWKDTIIFEFNYNGAKEAFKADK